MFRGAEREIRSFVFADRSYYHTVSPVLHVGIGRTAV